VKVEVSILVGFLRLMEHLYRKSFRVAIVVDDLDKLEDSKIMEILEVSQSVISRVTSGACP